MQYQNGIYPKSSEFSSHDEETAYYMHRFNIQRDPAIEAEIARLDARLKTLQLKHRLNQDKNPVSYASPGRYLNTNEMAMLELKCSEDNIITDYEELYQDEAFQHHDRVLTQSQSPNVCALADGMGAGEYININEALTSAGGTFVLGFFSTGNSTNRYIGIWYKTISKQTVIWIANRENPLAKNSHGVFGLGDDGNIVLLQGRKKVAWSSNATIAKLVMNSTLQCSGNLVLRHGDAGNVLLGLGTLRNQSHTQRKETQEIYVVRQ
ncbi:hypothetical protein ACSBR2_027591 [Camellia fascicularis]